MIYSPYSSKLKAEREIKKIDEQLKKIRNFLPVGISFVVSATIVVLAWRYPY